MEPNLRRRAAALASLGALLVITGCSGSETDLASAAAVSNVEQAGPTPPSVPPVPADQPAAVNARTERAIEHFNNREVTVVDPARERPTVSATQARDAGSAKLTKLRGQTPFQMSLVRFTDRVAGAEVLPESGLTPKLMFDNRLVWLMVYSKFNVPVFAPFGAEKTEPFYRSALAVFVDANSGEFLKAESLAESELDVPANELK